MKVLARPIAAVDFLVAAGSSAFALIAIFGYPLDVWLPRKYDWVAVPLFVGAVLPISLGLGLVTNRWVGKKLDPAYQPPP